MSLYTQRDARKIIKAYYGPDFKFRFLAGSTQIGVRPVFDPNPTLAWQKVATGNDSAVRIGELQRDCTIDWSWAYGEKQ